MGIVEEGMSDGGLKSRTEANNSIERGRKGGAVFSVVYNLGRRPLD
jgi:hypothetical protein